MPQTHLDRGRRAYDRRAWKDAYERLSRADRENALRAVDLERLATAAFLIGREKEFERTLERAHGAYRDAGERPGAARCAFWIGLLLYLGGKTSAATGWFARAQRLLDQEGQQETAEQGYLLLPIAEQHLGAGDSVRARAVAREAIGCGTRHGDRDLVAVARHVEGRALLEMGQIKEGFALLDETMVEVTSGELSPRMTGLLYCSVINCCQRLHALGRAREWTTALGRWCQDQRQMMSFTSTCLVHRAEILQLQGAWADALAEARRACQYTGWIDERPPGAAFYQQGEILRLRGELDAAESAYRSASHAGAEAQPGFALLWLARGRTRAAAAAIGRSLDATVEPLERARLLPARIEILLAAREYEAARTAGAELVEIAGRFPTEVLRATALQAMGTVELAAGKAREAMVLLRLAWKEWKALEVPHAAARAREALGLACRALGDREGGQLELEAARAAYENLGARPDVARVEALLRYRSGAGPNGLTSREVQVLRLVAAGKSNKEVGSALSLSVKTVERHVGNILTKLDVPSRAAATAWAYENEVVHTPR
jgi:ATP/maltotriose-dependent transcriptional regulator MalT